MTRLDGLLTANKVARKFEFSALCRRVFRFRDFLISCVKNAHLAGVRHSTSTGELLSSGFKREFWTTARHRLRGAGHWRLRILVLMAFRSGSRAGRL
jgi:hypothetical protein